jgi:hypothetical protein
MRPYSFPQPIVNPSFQLYFSVVIRCNFAAEGFVFVDEVKNAIAVL